MNKKVLTGLILLGLVTVTLAGCTRPASPSSPTLATKSPTASISSPPQPSTPSNNNSDSTSSVVQSDLPLQVTYPADGATLNAYTVTVTGKTQPGSTVSVNDAMSIADSNGNFSLNLNLDDGLNAIDVIAEDSNGNQGEVLLLENVDITQPPSLSSTAANSNPSSVTQDVLPLKVSSPADGATLSLADVLVKGQTRPGATVDVNDEENVADGAGNFAVPLTLVSGPNIIDSTASDDAGNQAEVILMVDLVSGA